MHYPICISNYLNHSGRIVIECPATTQFINNITYKLCHFLIMRQKNISYKNNTNAIYTFYYSKNQLRHKYK